MIKKEKILYLNPNRLKIKFSNFLSFGDNNVLDFKRLDGITVIDSNPPNFGGKTVLAVDLLLFLFFNNTTKTNKAEEIFNKFRNKNEVIVEGDVEIDGEDYFFVNNDDFAIFEFRNFLQLRQILHSCLLKLRNQWL